jgi:hypothetical protein
MLADLFADQRAVESQDFRQVLPRPAGVDDDACEAEAAAAAGAGRIIGSYRLLRDLGRGGVGKVWLAERPEGLIKRELALKLPHPGLATRDFAERLIRERDILAALAHVHISRLYDVGSTADGRPLARQQTRTAEAPLGSLEEIFNANSVKLPAPAAARKTIGRELLYLVAQRVDSALADAPAARFGCWPSYPVVTTALVDLAEAAGDNKRAYLARQTLDEAAAILDRQRETGPMVRARLTLARAHRMLGGSGWNEATLQRADGCFRFIRFARGTSQGSRGWSLRQCPVFGTDCGLPDAGVRTPVAARRVHR